MPISKLFTNTKSKNTIGSLFPMNRDLEKRHILTIEDVFEISGRGVLVLPDIPLNVLPTPAPTHVEMRNPLQVGMRTVDVQFEIPFLDPPPSREVGCLCLLKDITKAEVMIGSELWVLGESA
jgi:hypothetical protein